MRYGRLGFALIGALTVALSPAATYGQNIDGPGQYLPQRASGAGRWESTRAAGDKRDWQIEVERFDDDSIAGSIIVIGSPSLHKARIEGRVEGAEVYGVLVADGDKQVGTFTGTIGDAGLSGTYTTTEGDSGSWSWAGPAARQSSPSGPRACRCSMKASCRATARRFRRSGVSGSGVISGSITPHFSRPRAGTSTPAGLPGSSDP